MAGGIRGISSMGMLQRFRYSEFAILVVALLTFIMGCFRDSSSTEELE